MRRTALDAYRASPLAVLFTSLAGLLVIGLGGVLGHALFSQLRLIPIIGLLLPWAVIAGSLSIAQSMFRGISESSGTVCKAGLSQSWKPALVPMGFLAILVWVVILSGTAIALDAFRLTNEAAFYGMSYFIIVGALASILFSVAWQLDFSEQIYLGKTIKQSVLHIRQRWPRLIKKAIKLGVWLAVVLFVPGLGLDSAQAYLSALSEGSWRLFLMLGLALLAQPFLWLNIILND